MKKPLKNLNAIFSSEALFVLLCIVLLSQSLCAQNIMISNLNYPNEPSIAIDPKNTNVLIAGSNIDNYYYSIDSGYTWNENTLYSTSGVWGDPCIAVDTSSNFFFFHLADPGPPGNWIDRIVCQKTSNNGNTWNAGTYTGLNGTKQQDKHWCSIDRTTNTIYLTWTQFDSYGSANQTDSSIILFSKSIDAGDTWSTPVRINKAAGDCIDSDNTVEGAVSTVGPNGEIYVSWAGPNGIVFNKSLDQGNTWLNQEINVDAMPGGWDYEISGIYRGNGLPITNCDISNGPNRGTIYINWSDQRNGAFDTDIWLTKSTDGGQTWSSPIKVNNDSTNRQQFFTWMTIDQTNGYLYFVFYDRRNYSGDSTDVYMALSMDGGTTFINRKISQSPFLPYNTIFFGDYTNITAHNGVIRPIWTRLNNGQLSVWTNITRLTDFTTGTGFETIVANSQLNFENYPNPTSDIEYISFKLHEPSRVNLSLYSSEGKLVSEIIKNKIKERGKHIEHIELSKQNIPSGSYIIRLEINGEIKLNRVIKI